VGGGYKGDRGVQSRRTGELDLSVEIPEAAEHLETGEKARGGTVKKRLQGVKDLEEDRRGKTAERVF